MSKICQITGKRLIIGNRVSHSNKKTKRYFSINISKKRFFLTSEDRWITLKVSASGIKTINKVGIEKALKKKKKKNKLKKMKLKKYNPILRKHNIHKEIK